MPSHQDYAAAIRQATRACNAALDAIPHRYADVTPEERHAASAPFRAAHRHLHAVEDARDAGQPIPDYDAAA